MENVCLRILKIQYFTCYLVRVDVSFLKMRVMVEFSRLYWLKPDVLRPVYGRLKGVFKRPASAGPKPVEKTSVGPELLSIYQIS